MLIAHLAEHGTLHKAARYLSISQPAASGMLNDLESLIGLTLFKRGRQGVTPTDQAAAIVDRARTLLNEFSSLTETIGRISEGRERVLRVGLVPQAFAAYLPAAIEYFRAAGGCAVRAQESTARQLIESLLEGTLDCVIGRLSSEGLPVDRDISTLAFTPLYSEEICVVVGAGHQSRPGKATYADLATRQWVLQRKDSSVRRDVGEAFLRRGFRLPDPVVETTTYIQSLALIGESDLYTVAPRRPSQLQERLGAVRILNFSLDIAPMQIGFINRQSSESHPSVAIFRECFVRAVAVDNLRSGSGKRTQRKAPGRTGC
jgi:DNA-binding transcriptional LysR family regulator